MSVDDSTLATAQARLVAALASGQPIPRQFDEWRVVATAAMLRDKRRRAVTKCCPVLPRALAGKLAAHFDDYARAIPLATDARADALRFIGWLADRGEAPPELRAARRRLWLRRMLSRLAVLRSGFLG